MGAAPDTKTALQAESGGETAGFFLHMGNRLEDLAADLAEAVKAPLSSPFVPETILVQSRGMQRWVSMVLARQNGVFANGIFPFPNAFVDDLCRRLFPDLPPPEESLFHPSVLAFRVMALLPGCIQAPGFEQLRDYLADDPGKLKRVQLAERIADLFDQYLVFRPDLVFRWETGKNAHWQAKLWRRLSEAEADLKPEPHRARLHRELVERLRTVDAPIAGLPERVSVFGISYLPPFHLEVLKALSSRICVRLFFVNPCREYWADIAGRKEARRVSSKYSRRALDPASDLHLEEGNRILAATGTMGRDFLELVSDTDARPLERFTDPGAESLLCCVQSDILNLQNPTGRPAGADDGSIQIHSCHSPLREIEVLYDRLLAMFEEIPDLRPRDVLVMTPDIESYAPLIHSVFDARAEERRRIPYSVADKSTRSESPVAAGLLALMALVEGRLTATEVLALLEVPPLRDRFGIAEGDIALIERWVRQSGIRWGRDATTRAERGLPPFGENSWRAGIDRLLLGYAIPGEETLYEGIAPYGHIEGQEARTLGRFLNFVERLFTALDRMSEAHRPARWGELLATLLEDFFKRSEETEPEFAVLLEVLSHLVRCADLGGCREPFACQAVRGWLERQLESRSFGSGFISGGVTFCAMVPMRSIPFKIICMIGMNSGTFPRETRPLGFDLMAARPRPGDRNRREDDKYLFLEALVSARKCLYVSYVGQSIQDNTPLPASMLVSELTDALAAGYGVDADALVVRHRLQAFSPAYFQGDDGLYSYSTENLGAAEALFEQRVPHRFFDAALSLEKNEAERWRTLAPETLCEFFAQPTRFLLRQRLAIHLEAEAVPPEENETFSLGGLDAFLLGQDLLGRALKGKDPASEFELARARGALPHGSPGRVDFFRISADVRAFVEELRGLDVGPGLAPEPVRLDCGGFSIRGRLEDRCRSGLCRFRYGKMRSVDLLCGWIRHLILCTVLPEKGVTLLLFRDGAIRFAPVERPGSVLEQLLAHFDSGLRRPLHFFPNSSEAYARAITAGKPKPEALARARRQWASDFGRSESDDPYYRCCFRELDPLDEAFCTLSESVWGPLLGCLEPLARQ